MATFEEIGKYLDKLAGEGKSELMSKIVEDLILPNVKVEENKPIKLPWSQCTPRIFYRCVQLQKDNVDDVKRWLLELGGFYNVEITEDGIDTEYGELCWTDFIILEPNEAVVFIDVFEFEKQYIMNK